MPVPTLLLLWGCATGPSGGSGTACSGPAYPDADGDGWGVGAGEATCTDAPGYAAQGGDCDDGDPQRFPGAEEVCGDGLDQDCDGRDPACRLAGTFTVDELAVATWYGAAADDRFSIDLAAIPDATGDGVPDVLFGGLFHDAGGVDAGAAWLFGGPFSGTIEAAEADLVLVGESAGDRAGRAVAWLGDLDGDGAADLAVGAYFSQRGLEEPGEGPPDGGRMGAVYLVRTPRTGRVSLADADATIYADDLRWELGNAVDRVGDLDGDGRDDLVVGAWMRPPSETGGAVGWYGPLSGEHVQTEAEIDIRGAGVGERAGASVAGVGDVDGDGLADLGVGSPLWGSGQEGRVAIFLGPPPPAATTDDADRLLVGASPADWAGWSVAAGGDVDGDGLADLLVGAPGEDDSEVLAGRAYLVRGPVEVTALAEARAILEGEAPNNRTGHGLSGPGDLDGDGFADVAVGAERDGTTAERAGKAYLLHGPLQGHRALAEADVVILGAAYRDHLGEALAGGVDYSGDGLPDLLVGAYRESSRGMYAGAAYLVVPVAEAARRAGHQRSIGNISQPSMRWAR